MKRRFPVVITREDTWYVAHCIELGVVTQGKALDETRANLLEAVELYLESFDDEEIPEGSDEIILYPLEIGS